MTTPTEALALWLAQDAQTRRTQAAEALDIKLESTEEPGQKDLFEGLADVLQRLDSQDPPALREAAEALVTRGLAPVVVVKALVEQLHGARAHSMARWATPKALRTELLNEALTLAAGGSELWPDFIIRYADHLVDGVLRAVIHQAGLAALPVLVSVLNAEDQRDPDSESEGWAPLHAAELLGGLGEAAIAPLLDILPTLSPGEPLVDLVEGALNGLGDAVMAPTVARIEAATEDEIRLAYWMMLARTDIDDDRIRDALVALLPLFPEDAAYGLTIYGDVSVLPAVLAAFDALPDTDPVKVVDIAESIRHLGGSLNAEQQARATAAEQEATARLQAQYEAENPPGAGAPARRTLNTVQKTAARQKKKQQRQQKKKTRAKKK